MDINIDELPYGIMIIGKDQIIRKVNKAALKLMNKSTEDVEGKICHSAICHEKGYKCPICDIGKAEDYSEKLLRKNNETQLPIYKWVKQVTLNGEDVLLESFIDISDTVNIREKLKSSDQIKREFLANINHELRTPLNSVIGLSELLTKSIDNKKHKKHLSSIKRAGQNILTLINDVLDLSKIESKNLNMNIDPTNIFDLVNNIEQIFKESAERKGIELTTQIDNNLPQSIKIDEIKLRQIILHLVSNAIKFTEKGFVKISINQKNSDQHLCSIDLGISVQDSGIGISPIEKKRIFDQFTQQSTGNNRKYEGIGLGLSITKKLIDMMNGKIVVTSQVAKGTTFEVIFNNIEAAYLDVPSQRIKTMDLQNVNFNNAKVLIVEDTLLYRNVLKKLFKSANLDVIEAHNGEEGIIIAIEYKPDIIFMDIRMPIMDGLQAIKELRKIKHTQNIPIIALTGSIYPKNNMELLEHGFSGYLNKPISINSLFIELAKYLEFSLKEGRDAKKENTSSKVVPTINPKSINDLIKKLQTDVIPISKKLNGIINLEETSNFIETLNILGEQYGVPELIDYANNINEHCNNFDIPGLEASIAKLPKVINLLSTQVEEIR